MFHVLIYRLRESAALQWLAARATTVRYRWLSFAEGNLLFAALLLLPVLALASFARFAYVDHIRIVAERERRASLTCLAHNIYHESRGESLAGQQAVAEVTMNRVASRHYPDSVCQVVYEQRWDRRRQRYVGAFSWTEFDSVEEPRGVAWRRAAGVAESVYEKKHTPSVAGAMHYHATRITPYWAVGREPLVTIGRHVFYE